MAVSIVEPNSSCANSAVASQSAPELGDAESLYPAHMPAVGVAAGIELRDLDNRPTIKGSARVTVVDYCSDQCLVQEVTNLRDFLSKHRPDWSQVRWIRVQGLEDMETI